MVAQGVSDDQKDQPQKFTDISNNIYNDYNGQDQNHPHLYIVKSKADITIKGVEQDAMGNVIPPTVEVNLTATKIQVTMVLFMEWRMQVLYYLILKNLPITCTGKITQRIILKFNHKKGM